MTRTPPPRLVPERAFPPYAYLPGRHPHPTRDPAGHSAGAALAAPEPPAPEDWRACGDYLYGIDLFNHGYYWEAHEAWEGLWAACGRTGATATYLQGLINLAAAGFKARSANARGMQANARTAHRLLASAIRQLGPGRARHMGLDVQALADLAAEIAAVRPERRRRSPDGERELAFDAVLRPEQGASDASRRLPGR